MKQRPLLALLGVLLFVLATESLGDLLGAGRLLWLVPLVVAGGLFWVLYHLCMGARRADAGSVGADAGSVRADGIRPYGLGLLFLWGFFLFAVHAGRIAQNLAPQGLSLPLVLLVLGMLTLYICKNDASTNLGRTAQILQLIFLVLLLFSLPLVFRQSSLALVLPPARGDFGALPQTCFRCLGLLSLAGFAVFLCPAGEQEAPQKRLWIGTMLGFGLLTAVIFLAVVACFGLPLLKTLPQPLTHVFASVSLEGGFQRPEALFSALWFLGEILLLAFLLLALSRIYGKLFAKKMPHWACCVLALLLAYLLLQNEGVLQGLLRGVVPLGGLIAMPMFFIIHNSSCRIKNEK